VFDELVCDGVWAGCFVLWGSLYGSCVVSSCDVCVKCDFWVYRCVMCWWLDFEIVRVGRLCPWGLWEEARGGLFLIVFIMRGYNFYDLLFYCFSCRVSDCFYSGLASRSREKTCLYYEVLWQCFGLLS
jgi:hypothetical protein